MADSAVAYGSLPFKEQIAFFRAKGNVLTEHWTDVWQAGHDRGFMVAGANRTDLLQDLRAAVDRAIADGTGLEAFRRDFDAIVAKYGWEYTGGRNWRSRVIYETNLRTSYAAGRYAQLQALKKVRPYWRYRHSDAVEHPRPLHLSWNGLALRADDPWWHTHYPPNGWGCQCTVEALNDRDLKRLGKDGPDTAPPDDPQTVIVGKNGPAPFTVETPAGVDPGFGYAPGKSVLDDLAPRFDPLPPAPAAMQPAATRATVLPPLPAPRVVSADRLLPTEMPLDRAIDQFLGEFGAKRGAPVVFDDVAGDPLVISERLFQTRTGRPKELARLEERKPGLLLLADAIRDPDEIWLYWYAVNEASGAIAQQLRRRYLRRVILAQDGEQRDGFVAFELGRYGWTGTTAFEPDSASYLERQRHGELIYTRIKKGRP